MSRKHICVSHTDLDQGYSAAYQSLLSKGWRVVLVLGGVTDMQGLLAAQAQTGNSEIF